MKRKDSKGILHYTDVDGNIVYVSCDDSMADIEAYVNGKSKNGKEKRGINDEKILLFAFDSAAFDAGIDCIGSNKRKFQI